ALWGQLDAWMQLSVHGGTKLYLMVQFVRPPHLSQRQADALFREFGWRHRQADNRDCLVYYLARSNSWEQLLNKGERVAAQCALAIAALWGTVTPDQIVMLGARGPSLSIKALGRAPVTKRITA